MLQYANDNANEELEQFDYEPASVNVATDSQVLKEAMLSRLISANSVAVNNINKFQKDMICTASLLVGTPDEFNIFQIE